MSGLTIRERPGGVRFEVRVQPRASRDELMGIHGGALRIRLHAPPVDGAANDALIIFLAHALGVSRRSVRIVSGASSRTKTVEVDGIGREQVERFAHST